MNAPVRVGLPFDPKTRARSLFWCGWDVSDIAEALEIPRTTVQSWKDRGKWDEASPRVKAAECTYVRYMQLVMKETYTPSDVRDIDLLGRRIESFEKIRRFHEPDGHSGDLNDKVANRNKGDRKKPAVNLISPETVAKLKEALERGMYVFQQDWLDSQSERIRMILKSRQIGATFHFARERLLRALETGNNQIFISASRAQANIFRQYIVEFVLKETGVKLKGDPMVIDRGEDENGERLEPVTLYFLGTNYRTAQGYHGDVIIDEYAWIYGFEQLYSVAKGMATQKRYTITLFSTPSTVHHESYVMWSGERFNRRRAKGDRVRVDVSHDTLQHGVRGPDGVWRQIVTLADAIARGYDLIDEQQLQLECSVEEFDNLYRCMFLDDSKSSFQMALIRPCLVESFDVWKDFKPYALRPYAGEVWIGYDPNDNDGGGDPAGLVILAAPNGRRGKFRLLERRKLIGLDFEEQAAEIRKVTETYHVTEIAIDTKGVGSAVFQLVQKFHPLVRRIDYSPMVKSLMVQKAQNVFRNRRIEIDCGATDVFAALISIHPEVSKGGSVVTYKSSRSAETGHGDVGWALLNALYCEPLDAGDTQRTSTVEIYS